MYLGQITTVTGYISATLVILSIVFKGLPEFIKLYTVAQEGIRRDLIEEVRELKLELGKERSHTNELWDRIETMRQIVNHLVVRVNVDDPLGGALARAYNTPDDMKHLLDKLNDPEPRKRTDEKAP